MSDIDIQDALNDLEGAVDDVAYAEGDLEGYASEISGIPDDIKSVVVNHGGCDLDEVTSIDFDASCLQERFNAVSEMIEKLETHYKENIESLEHEMSALEEQSS